MSISHATIYLPADKPVMFAQLADVSCSVCAPLSMSQRDVEAFATRVKPIFSGWACVDKSKLPGFGSATPNPCNHDSGRRHWFLLSAIEAAQLGFETDK